MTILVEFLVVMGLVFLILLFLGSTWYIFGYLVYHASTHAEIGRRLDELEGNESKGETSWY